MPKFKIGEAVVHKSIQVELTERWQIAVEVGRLDSALAVPKVYIITSVFTEVCYGGCEQVSYAVEYADQGVKRFTEECLIPAKEVYGQFKKLSEGLLKLEQESRRKRHADTEDIFRSTFTSPGKQSDKPKDKPLP